MYVVCCGKIMRCPSPQVWVCDECKRELSVKTTKLPKIKKPKEPKVYHLVKEGDSLFGAVSWACGIKAEDSQGYLEPEKVTCGVCKRTKLYKELMEV